MKMELSDTRFGLPKMSEKLTAAQDALRLEDIYLCSMSSGLRDSFVPTLALEDGARIRVDMRHGAKRHSIYERVDTDTGVETNFVEFVVEFGARFRSSDAAEEDGDKEVSEDDVIASITAHFAMLYRMVKDVDPDCLEEFGRDNAPFHAWPYWRELLQSAASRMKMPAPVLPMYRRATRASQTTLSPAEQGKTQGSS
jgi:hypothetical protein